MSATPTPRTDSLERELNDLGSPEGSSPLIEALKHARLLEGELSAALRWKQEALTVESWWKKVDAHVRAQPDARLGENVSSLALEFLEQRVKLIEKAERYRLVTLRQDGEIARLNALLNGVRKR